MWWVTFLLAVALAYIFLRERRKARREDAERQEDPREVPGWREALDAKYARSGEPPTPYEEIEREFERRREAGPEGGWTTPPNTDARWREMERWDNKLGREEERRIEAQERKEEREEVEAGKREEWMEMLTDFLGREPTKKEDTRLRVLFGGWDQCLYNFSMYETRARNGATALVVPADDHYRPRFETLADTGAILRGADVAPLDRLECLGMDQLRVLADAVGAKRAQGKDELRRRIAAQGAEAVAAAWPALGIPDADVFLLDPERVRTLCQ